MDDTPFCCTNRRTAYLLTYLRLTYLLTYKQGSNIPGDLGEISPERARVSRDGKKDILTVSLLGTKKHVPSISLLSLVKYFVVAFMTCSIELN